MKKDIALSIMLSSLIATGSISTIQSTNASDKSDSAKKIDKESPTSSGKCASGKCGTEKIYDKVNLKHNPQDRLVAARDGKCGLNGKGLKPKESPEQIKDEKLVGGLCGN